MTEVRISSDDTGLLGMPIKGSIQRGYKRKDQRPKSEFASLVQAALDVDGIEVLRWRQYTPYFNDGDACVFSAHGLEVTVNGVEIEDIDWGDNAAKVLGTRPRTYGTNGWVYGAYEGPDEDRYNTLQALADAIGGGAFDDVLLDLFGDHAEVKITKGQDIEVDSVDHD